MVQHIAHFFDALHTHLATGQHAREGVKSFLVGPLECQQWLQRGYRLVTQAFFLQLSIDIVDTDLIEFINGDRDIHDFVGSTNNLGDTAEDFTVIQLNGDIDVEAVEHLVNHGDQLHLIEQGVATHDVGITLVKLAVTALLGTVGAPHRLHLVALERHLQVVAMLHHIAGKRHRQVIAQTFLADFGRQVQRVMSR